MNCIQNFGSVNKGYSLFCWQFKLTVSLPIRNRDNQSWKPSQQHWVTKREASREISDAVPIDEVSGKREYDAFSRYMWNYADWSSKGWKLRQTSHPWLLVVTTSDMSKHFISQLCHTTLQIIKFSLHIVRYTNMFSFKTTIRSYK